MTGNVVDRFEVKGRTALEYGAAGVVVMFRSEGAAPLPKSGEPILVVRADGWLYSGRAEDVRNESAGSSAGMFLRDLTADDVPIGSLVRWGDEIRSLTVAVA